MLGEIAAEDLDSMRGEDMTESHGKEVVTPRTPLYDERWTL